MTSPSWKNFVMFHKALSRENYTCDPNFTFENYQFIEANPNVLSEIESDFFDGNIIKEWELPKYDDRLQSATYMAPSVIYHLYKNNVHKDLDFIGFLEYDIPMHLENGQSVTQKIHDIISKNERVILPFRYQHTLATLRGQKDIKMNGQNAVDQIFEDYNAFFGTNHKPQPFLNHNITTQQSFLADKKTFEKIMNFIAHVIENKLAERQNSWHRPSTLMDRYFGISLLLEDDAKTIALPLEHQNMKQWSETAGRKDMSVSKNYQQKGWDIIPNVLNAKDCEKARDLMNVDGEKLSKDVGTEKSSRRMAVMYRGLFFKQIIKKIKNHPTIKSLLSDFEDPIVEHMKPLIKAPGGGVETPWHQDSAFWTGFDPERTMFTIWIALTSTTEKTGAMKVLDNINPEPVLPHEHTHNGNERVIESKTLETLLNDGDVVPCELQPGDALIFRSDVVHSAFQNHGDSARIAFKLVFQDAKKRATDVKISKFGFHLEGLLGKLNLNTPINLFWSR